MTSSVPKTSVSGIPYAQHGGSGCFTSGFGTVSNTGSAKNAINELRASLTQQLRFLYKGGSGISIDTSSICPIINLDPTDITALGNPTLPFTITSSKLQLNVDTACLDVTDPAAVGAKNVIQIVGGGSAPQLPLATIQDKATLTLDAGRLFTDPSGLAANTSQYAGAIIFATNSTNTITTNNMCFAIYPENVGGGAFPGFGQRLAMGHMNAAGNFVTIALFSPP